jgi:hypothetical protein
MNASPDPDRPLLIGEGFEWSPRFAGCWIKRVEHGEYVVFQPIDCKSGKYEMHYQSDNRLRVDFPPATARGIVRHVRKHEAAP